MRLYYESTFTNDCFFCLWFLNFLSNYRLTTFSHGFVVPASTYVMNPCSNPTHSIFLPISASKKSSKNVRHQPSLRPTTTFPSKRTESGQPASPHRLQMFTGIVEEMGTVIDLVKKENIVLWDGTVSEGYELTVQSYVVLDETSFIGCSICVSGVCLTVTNIDQAKKEFQVGLAQETLKRTYFSKLHAGSLVNLERAALTGGRNSGHTVQGHVDCTGTILSKVYEGDSLVMTIQVDDESIMPYIVPKGFIAIDGTSLTVITADATKLTFTFMLISFTQKHIIVPLKNINDKVNIEVDVLAKYASSILSASSSKASLHDDGVCNEDNNPQSYSSSNIDETIRGMIKRIDELESKVKEMELQIYRTKVQ